MPLATLETFENGFALGHVFVVRSKHHRATPVPLAIEFHQDLAGQGAGLAAFLQIGQLLDCGELRIFLQTIHVDVNGGAIVFIEFAPFGM